MIGEISTCVCASYLRGRLESVEGRWGCGFETAPVKKRWICGTDELWREYAARADDISGSRLAPGTAGEMEVSDICCLP